LFARFQQCSRQRVVGQNTRAVTRFQEAGNGSDHTSDALNAWADKRIDLMAVHEPKAPVADALGERVRHSSEERMCNNTRVHQLRRVLIVVARHIKGLHPREAIQKAATPGYDPVERIAEQLKEVTDDDELPILLVNVVKKGTQQCLAIGLTQTIRWGAVPDV
jgi:hypothetical protein